MAIIEKIQSSLLELILAFYLSLMNFHAPIRMAIIILTIAVLAPILLWIALFLLQFLFQILVGSLEKGYDKIGEVNLNRRKQGKSPFFGIGIVDTLLSLLTPAISKLNGLFLKARELFPKAGQNYMIIAVICMFLFPVWGVLSPAGAIGTAWQDFEKDLIKEHFKEKGFDPKSYKSLALFSKEFLTSDKSKADSGGPTKNAIITPADKAKSGVHIRKAPGTENQSLDVLAYGETGKYLDKAKANTGVVWYKIKTERNVTGWVSSKATVVQE